MPIRRLGLWNLALVVAGAAALIIEGEARAKAGLSPGAFVLAVAAAAPLAWRTRAPVAALVGVEVGAVLCVAIMGRWNWWMPNGLARLLRLPPATPTEHPAAA